MNDEKTPEEEPTPEEAVEQQGASAEAPDAGAGEASGDAEADPQEEISRLRQRLEQVEKELSEADVRAQAEVQNVRRRAERDVEHAHKFALEKFAGEILAVADSLERALAQLDADNEALAPAREGTELTLKALLDVFARFGIEQIDARGEAFDPEKHEAMTMVPSPDAEPNTVIEVLEKGYLLNGRLLRPARVVVAKAPEG